MFVIFFKELNTYRLYILLIRSFMPLLGVSLELNRNMYLKNFFLSDHASIMFARKGHNIKIIIILTGQSV